jgi:hypothetical protein
MASLSFEDLLSISKQGSEGTSDDIEQSRAAPTAIDYAGDIIRAPLKGLSRSVQGLLELGALPIDYLANTNLLKHIDDTFNKFTPETHTTVGEIAATLTQFGLPLGAVTKLAGGIKFLNRATEYTKLSKLTSVGDKAGELVRRAGYYGAIGGASDIIASVPERDQTLTESLGLTEKTDLSNLEGSERAAETLKEKFKFGAEGTVVGGAVPLLPVVGTLGVNYGLVPAGNAIRIAGKAVLEPLDYAVFNPLSKAIAGVESKGLIPKLMTTTSELVDKGLDKLGVPAVEEWKSFSKQGTWKEYFFKTLDNVKNQFTVDGKMGPAITNTKTYVNNTLDAGKDYILKKGGQIDQLFEDIIDKGKVRFFENKDSMFSLQSKKNDLFNYLEEIDPNKHKVFFNMLDEEIKPMAKNLKELIRESNTQYAKFLLKEGGDDYGKLAQLILEEKDGLMKQRYSAFHNKDYQFPVEANEKAAQFMQRRLLENDKNFLKNAEIMAEKEKISIGAAQKKLTEKDLNSLKYQVINSDKTPEYFFNAIADAFRLDRPKDVLRPGQTFDQVIRDLFDAPQTITKGGKTIPITNYKTAVIDTITQQASTIQNKRFFDYVAEEGVRSGYIFKSRQEAMAMGKSEQFALELQRIKPPGQKMDSFAFKESKLFQEEYFATPEFAHAILDTSTNTLSNLYKSPVYRSIMGFKSGTQIAKTLFSPMGQVRNFTSNALVLTYNGILNGSVSMKDATKVIMQDIFNTVSKGGEDGVSTYLNEAKKYGVIGQNVETNELKYILNKTRTGKYSFENFTRNPLVNKLADIYQGSDNFWKVYADKYYTAALRPAMKSIEDVKDWFKTVAKQEFNIKDFEKATDKNLEQGIREISAHLVTHTMPTYSRIPPIIENVRHLPLGNFVAYPAQIISTSSNALMIGARELTSNNPFIRQMGARRLIGATTTLGAIGPATLSAAQYITGMDSETLDAFQRHFAPDYEKNSTLIPVTAPDSKGNFKYINFSYTNPYNTIVQPINAVMKAYGDGSLNKDGADTIVKNALFGTKDRHGALYELLQPFISESIGLETMADIQYRDGKTKSGKHVYYPQDDSLTKLSKSIGHIFSTLEPGAVTSARRIWDGATGRFTDAGTVRDGATEAVALMSGVRVNEAKPMSSMPFILSSYSNDRQNIGSKFSSIAYSPTATQEERIHSFRDYFVESYDNQNRMYQTLQSAKKLGIDESELRNILTQRLKNRTDVNNLMNGIYKTPVYSEDRFKSLINRLNEESPMQASKVETQIENTKDVFRDLRGNFIGTDLSLSRGDFEKQIDKFLTPSVIRSRPTTPTPKIDLSSTFTPPNNYLQSNIPLSPNVSPAVVNAGNQNLSTKITPQKQAEYDAFFRR